MQYVFLANAGKQQCKPSEKAYSHYAPTAVFHDPVSIAKGKESIQSQFNGSDLTFTT